MALAEHWTLEPCQTCAKETLGYTRGLPLLAAGDSQGGSGPQAA